MGLIRSKKGRPFPSFRGSIHSTETAWLVEVLEADSTPRTIVDIDSRCDSHREFGIEWWVVGLVFLRDCSCFKDKSEAALLYLLEVHGNSPFPTIFVGALKT